MIQNIHAHTFDYKQLVGILHENFKCAIGLDIDGKPMAACGGDDAFRQFRLEELNREIAQLRMAGKKGQNEMVLLSQATFENFDTIHAQLEKCGIEAILPIYDDGRILGTLKFGRGFSDKIYSKQDFQLISALWAQLVVALKYIRKLEEQIALKDHLIEKLNQQIELQKPCALKFESRRRGLPEQPGRAALISKRNDLVLPLESLQRYDHPAGALTDPEVDVVIIDGRAGLAAVSSQLRNIRKPLIIIGSHQNLPEGLEGPCIDVIAPDQINERLIPAMRFLQMMHRAICFHTDGKDFITVSPKLLNVLERLSRTATPARTILITGETGTGKELIASYIGQICKKKIISVNCAAINTGLFESAFCGHEKGAFTGADKCHRGYLEQADKAILFLDEISELPLGLQAKLLRIIEGAPFQRVGGRTFIRPDVQFVCATNRDLKQLAKTGKFRQDLLYRLDQLSFELPPLRRRSEDIALLSGHFLLRFNRQYRTDASINDALMKSFESHAWPGNVRELSNAVLKRVLDAKNETAMPDEKTDSLPEKIKSFEAALIHASLKRHASKSKAARALGIPFSTLRSKIKKIDIGREADPIQLDLPLFQRDLPLTEKLYHYEASLISDSLERCETQSEAARALGIPLSTLRSKLKKHNIEARTAT